MTDTIDEATEHTERTLAEALANHRGTIPEACRVNASGAGITSRDWSAGLVRLVGMSTN